MGVNEVALGLTIGIAAFTDWREHKIYNKLLFPALLIAFILHLYQGGVLGLMASFWGAIIGFIILLLPYFLGGMGAGDVKLLTVIGAFGGAHFVIVSFLIGAIIGGLISICLLIRQKALLHTMKYYLFFFPIVRKYGDLSETISNAHQDKFPYGIALALGAFIVMFLPHGGRWL